MFEKSIVDSPLLVVGSANRPLSTVHSFVLLIIGLLVSSLTASAQYSGFKPVDDLAGFKKQFSAEAKKITSIKSNFVQEKNLTLLEEKMASEGKFTFRRENKVRIEYTKPFQYLMIMNGDLMLVRDNQKESKVNVKSNKLFQQVNKIMVDCVQGTMLDNKDFTVRVFQNDKNFILEMTPVSKTLKEFFQTIIVYAEKKDYSVSSIDMREPSGDNTIIKFVQKELNVTVADELFAVK
jgi:outer membrane lipoprotein-sorting protein